MVERERTGQVGAEERESACSLRMGWDGMVAEDEEEDTAPGASGSNGRGTEQGSTGAVPRYAARRLPLLRFRCLICPTLYYRYRVAA